MVKVRYCFILGSWTEMCLWINMGFKATDAFPAINGRLSRHPITVKYDNLTLVRKRSRCDCLRSWKKPSHIPRWALIFIWGEQAQCFTSSGSYFPQAINFKVFYAQTLSRFFLRSFIFPPLIVVSDFCSAKLLLGTTCRHGNWGNAVPPEIPASRGWPFHSHQHLQHLQAEPKRALWVWLAFLYSSTTQWH